MEVFAQSKNDFSHYETETISSIYDKTKFVLVSSKIKFLTAEFLSWKDKFRLPRFSEISNPYFTKNHKLFWYWLRLPWTVTIRKSYCYRGNNKEKLELPGKLILGMQ